MDKLKRVIHIDFHTMPGIDDFGTEFNAEALARTLYEANVTYVNLFARCNIGFSYYKTKIGKEYPTMKGDMLREAIEQCHRYGIGVTAYLNAGLNHELCVDHPEYMKIDKNGVCMGLNRADNNFFRTPCFNTGYRDYLLSEISEIASLDADGVFCDCMIPRSCYCPSCMKKMSELGIDTNDDMEVYKFAVDTLMDVFAQIKKIVPENKRLYLNSFPYEMNHQYVSHAEVECLPTDGEEWGYEYFGVQAPYYRNFSKDRIYMTGRFVGGWGDFGGVKSKASMENDLYDALLCGYQISISDHMHPRGMLDTALYKTIGEIYSDVKKLEPWIDTAEPLADLCVLRNKTNHSNILNRPTSSEKGVCRMLSELKICYDVRDEDMDISGYSLLILPDDIVITDKLAAKLDDFDGAILSSGESISDKKAWDYISSYKNDIHSECYYDLGDGNVRAAYEPGVLMESENSFVSYIEPYFDRVWDGRHGYFYIPPKGETKYSMIAARNNRVHIAFKIFSSYNKNCAWFHKKLISDILEKLLPNKLIKSDELPVTSRAAVSKCDKGTLLYIKATYPEHRGSKGIIEEHSFIPAGRKVSIFGKFSSARVIPGEKELEISFANGYTEITLPQICGFIPICLTK